VERSRRGKLETGRDPRRLQHVVHGGRVADQRRRLHVFRRRRGLPRQPKGPHIPLSLFQEIKTMKYKK
jgi:hypothetical protein